MGHVQQQICCPSDSVRSRSLVQQPTRTGDWAMNLTIYVESMCYSHFPQGPPRTSYVWIGTRIQGVFLLKYAHLSSRKNQNIPRFLKCQNHSEHHDFLYPVLSPFVVTRVWVSRQGDELIDVWSPGGRFGVVDQWFIQITDI